MHQVNGSYKGLTQKEAQERLEKWGPNEIKHEEKKSPWPMFLEQFKGPLVIILILASVLSAFLGEWAETMAIGAILVLNALIGFFQEYRAENAIEALRNMTAPRATIIRDGTQRLVAAAHVVPGDLLLLESGDIVAADGKILSASRLQINEAVLTGESLPVEKKAEHTSSNEPLAQRQDQVFMGTAVATGSAQVLVEATGMNSELGKIAHLITTAQSSLTPLQIQLNKVGRMLLILCLSVVTVVLLLGVWQQRPWLELVVFSISLAVAAVPEGMPAIVTVALALGVQRMAARKALVRKLPSVETLGSVTVICTDKTGTLTTGNMRVREIWGEDHRLVLHVATACSEAELSSEGDEGTGDTTELAILLAAREREILKASIEEKNPRLLTNPFDSDRKRMSIYRQDQTLYAKGAFESLLPLLINSPAEINLAQKAVDDMTSRGLRVLAVATGKTEEEKNLTLIGLLGLADPPRTEAQEAITLAKSAGVRPIMITGDHPTTAVAIARELGLLTDSEKPEGIVHARATPEDKLKLVRQWKSQGAVVAMTGDGVNDAPALREAHIGIAMGKNGTEVTRQSADLVLADDNFATIVAAIGEGRNVYQSIRKAITYLLTGNFAELAVVLGATALGLPLPFHAAHLLWINLVTDSLPGLALIADPISPDIMKRPPRHPKELLLGKPQWVRIVWVGVLEAIITLFVFLTTWQNEGEEMARNLAFTTLVFSQLWRSFGARSQTRIFWEVGALSNLWLLGVVIVTSLLQLGLHYIPLSQQIFGLGPLTLQDLGMILPLSLIPITVIELKKLLGRLA